MKSVIVVLIICEIIICVENTELYSRLVNGQDARSVKQFPYMVSLRSVDGGFHFCGGSIIGEKYILTAAHCLEDKTRKNFYVVAGTRFVNIRRKLYYVHRFAIHVGYQPESLRNDIAIIKLKTNIKFSRFIQKIPLATSDTPVGVTMTVSGWGDQKENDINGPTVLQYSDVTSISLQKCRRLMKKFTTDHDVTNEQLCTYDRNIGFCHGDSGGPLVYNGKQVGIVSWSVNCATSPDVYIKVYAYRNWVKTTVARLNRIL